VESTQRRLLAVPYLAESTQRRPLVVPRLGESMLRRPLVVSHVVESTLRRRLVVLHLVESMLRRLLAIPCHLEPMLHRLLAIPHHLKPMQHRLLAIPCHLEPMLHRPIAIPRHLEPILRRPRVIPCHPVVLQFFPRERRMRRRSTGFGVALRAVRAALGLSQDVLGARLGVSRRTLTRWECHDELPPVGQRKHIATSFQDAPYELRAALVRSLALGDGFVASFVAPRPAPPPAGADLDGAFLELCERVDVAPGRLRAGLVEFLRRAEASGLSLQTTRARLDRPAKPPTRARA
jgi:transcriptional regulator with XRE-family HTH domain